MDCPGCRYAVSDNVARTIIHFGILEDFSTLCLVRADLSPLSGSAETKKGKNGKVYWTIIFSVEIHFGLTEFRARIKWVDNVSLSNEHAPYIFI